MNTTLALVSPYIDRWRAVKASSSADDQHIQWDVTYDFNSISTPYGDVWPVFATLHAGGSGGWGDISVAAFIKNAHDVDLDEFEEVLAGSEAVETLYDFARSHFVPMLAGIGAEVVMPKGSPTPTMLAYEDEENSADAENRSIVD